MLIEWVKHGKPTLVGTATGCIAGLATITPASGFVGPSGALLIGILAAVLCYYMVGFVKNIMKIDDTLDVFAVHGVGGLLGTLLLAPLGSTSLRRPWAFRFVYIWTIKSSNYCEYICSNLGKISIFYYSNYFKEIYWN